jgi:MoxR-like ATPase
VTLFNNQKKIQRKLLKSGMPHSYIDAFSNAFNGKVLAILGKAGMGKSMSVHTFIKAFESVTSEKITLHTYTCNPTTDQPALIGSLSNANGDIRNGIFANAFADSHNSKVFVFIDEFFSARKEVGEIIKTIYQTQDDPYIKLEIPGSVVRIAQIITKESKSLFVKITNKEVNSFSNKKLNFDFNNGEVVYDVSKKYYTNSFSNIRNTVYIEKELPEINESQLDILNDKSLLVDEYKVTNEIYGLRENLIIAIAGNNDLQNNSANQLGKLPLASKRRIDEVLVDYMDISIAEKIIDETIRDWFESSSPPVTSSLIINYKLTPDKDKIAAIKEVLLGIFSAFVEYEKKELDDEMGTMYRLSTRVSYATVKMLTLELLIPLSCDYTNSSYINILLTKIVDFFVINIASKEQSETDLISNKEEVSAINKFISEKLDEVDSVLVLDSFAIELESISRLLPFKDLKEVIKSNASYFRYMLQKEMLNDTEIDGIIKSFINQKIALFVGSSGSGKTRIARKIPQILEEITQKKVSFGMTTANKTTDIHSVTGSQTDIFGGHVVSTVANAIEEADKDTPSVVIIDEATDSDYFSSIIQEYNKDSGLIDFVETKVNGVYEEFANILDDNGNNAWVKLDTRSNNYLNNIFGLQINISNSDYRLNFDKKKNKYLNADYSAIKEDLIGVKHSMPIISKDIFLKLNDHGKVKETRQEEKTIKGRRSSLWIVAIGNVGHGDNPDFMGMLTSAVNRRVELISFYPSVRIYEEAIVESFDDTMKLFEEKYEKPDYLSEMNHSELESFKNEITQRILKISLFFNIYKNSNESHNGSIASTFPIVEMAKKFNPAIAKDLVAYVLLAKLQNEPLGSWLGNISYRTHNYLLRNLVNQEEMSYDEDQLEVLRELLDDTFS